MFSSLTGHKDALLLFHVVDEIALPSRTERWYPILWLYSAGKETQVRHEKFRDHEGGFIGRLCGSIDQRDATAEAKDERCIPVTLLCLSFYTIIYSTYHTRSLFSEILSQRVVLQKIVHALHGFSTYWTVLPATSPHIKSTMVLPTT